MTMQAARPHACCTNWILKGSSARTLDRQGMSPSGERWSASACSAQGSGYWQIIAPSRLQPLREICTS